MKTKPKILIPLLLLVLALVSSPALADKAALLIGVGKYAQAPNLDGPPHDVAAMKNLLTRVWGFNPARIKTLVNSQATKAAILQELNSLTQRTSSGDTVFIYFSCHGTSAFAKEESVRNLGLDPFTGALVPADYRLGRDVAETKDNLIIGKQDLRPILERLDEDRRVFAVVDACYAELALRSALARKLPWRYMRIPWYRLKGGPKKTRSATGVDEDLFDDDMITSQPGRFNNPQADEPPYPYKHLIYISASSKRDPAVDINQTLIRLGHQTVDGKPHGALTNALLLGLSGWADSDHDGRVTYRELHSFSQQEVSREWPHTPQLRYNQANSSIDRPAFGVGSAKLQKPPAKPGGDLRIKPDNLPKDLVRKISALARVRIAEQDYELRVSQTGDEYLLSLPNGTRVISCPLSNPDRLLERIERQAGIKELAALETPRASFNVFLEVTGRPGVLLEGDKIGFRIKAGEAAHIMLLNVDPRGRVSVIYPCYEPELARLPAGHILNLPGMGQVSPPLGTEYLKVVAFRTIPTGFKEFMGAAFNPEDSRLGQLLEMIKDAGASAAQTTLAVTTADKDEMRSLLR